MQNSAQQNLGEFVAETEQWIDDTLNKLGWTKQSILNAPDLVTCPINKSHKMPPSSLEKHLRYCSLVQEGYTREEIDADSSSKFFYEKAKNVVSVDLDGETIAKIANLADPASPVSAADVPATMSHYLTGLSRGQRLAVYEHCVGVARAANVATSIPLEQLQFLDDNGQGREGKSLLELKAEERDMKRRRQSYKGRSVSTKNKSHLQVIREVISSQTDMLSQRWREEQQEKEREKYRAERDKERAEREKERAHERSKEPSSERSSSHYSRHRKEAKRKHSHRADSEERSHKHKHKKHKKHKHRQRSESRDRSEAKEKSRSRDRPRSEDRSRSVSKEKSAKVDSTIFEEQ